MAGHAAVPYMQGRPPELLWPVHEQATSPLADFIAWWARCAQSQLLFTVAGVLSARSIASHGPRAFALSRARRIGVPFFAGIVFVLPIMAAVLAWGWLTAGVVPWEEVRAWRFTDPTIQRNLLGPGHLWFLQDLMTISLGYAAWSHWRSNTRPTIPA